MDFIKYLKAVNAEKQIKKLEQKYCNKKIILYGGGLFASVLLKNYDLSKLNIIAVADKKYDNNSKELFCGYKTISPEELTKSECDVILTTVICGNAIIDYLNNDLLIGTKIEDVEIAQLIHPTLSYCLKTLIFG